MSCNNVMWQKGKDREYHSIPCGCCMACRIDRREMWSDRFRTECQYASWANSGNSFVCLTYNDFFLPKGGTLSPDDASNFIKRLRRRIEYHKSAADSENIRPDWKYFLVGEYGEKGRPHYHVMFSGIPADVARPWIESCWLSKDRTAPIGNVDIGPLLNGGIRYILSYIDKEQNDDVDNIYRQNGVEPPFSLKSHGIGKRFLIENAEFILQNGGYRHNGTIRPIPRYYEKLLGVEHTNKKSLSYEIVKALNEGQGSLDNITLRSCIAKERALLASVRNKGKPVNELYIQRMEERYIYLTTGRNGGKL